MSLFKKIPKRLLVTAGIITLIAIVFFISQVFGSTTIYSVERIGPTQEQIDERAQEMALGILTQKKEDLQQELLDELATCESGINDAAMILDTNAKMSIGRYQWQRESVIHYYAKLYDEEIDMLEAIKIAIDSERSTNLTRDVLFNEEGGWTNWRNCANKLSIAGKITLIKRITE